MTSSEQNERNRRGWADRVAFTSGPNPVAYTPGQIIVPVEAETRTRELAFAYQAPEGNQAELEFESLAAFERPDYVRQETSLARYVLARNVPQPELIVRQLRSERVDAQLNHVYFAHCGDCCAPHPAQAAAGGCGVGGSPVYATPVYATPVYATPVYATPVYATPVYATGAEQATGRRTSSAIPATADEAGDMVDVFGLVPATVAADAAVNVMVLDVGRAVEPYRPSILGPVDAMSQEVDVPDADGNDSLDPVAGHTEFIIGLIKSIAPQANVAARRVLHPEGDGKESDIVQAIDILPDARPWGGAVLNLSFGGYILDDAPAMGAAVRGAQARGWVVVASAGNDGICRPTYPAAFADVVSVGAIGPHGPAPFTNYGPWVRACAPGVDLVSTFFVGYDKDTEKGDFEGWARWSGTSFSAPIVAGAITALAMSSGVTTAQSAARLVDAPGLMKLVNLGTPINMV